MPLRLATLAVAVLLAPLAAAAPGVPPSGKVLLGVVGPDPEAFDRVTGRHHPLHVMFGEWTRQLPELLATERAAGRLPVLSVRMSNAPLDVARGAEDARWVTLSQTLNEAQQTIWVRLFPEMTGSWNPYCAFDEAGRSRGARYATSAFIAAFRRVAIILDGGPRARLNAKLHAAGLAGLRGGTNLPASGRIAIVWNPQGHGVPDIAANGPQAYWPGPGYVDIVANDLYSDSGEPSWQGMDTLYAYGKPYLVAEWALEAEDDPAWAQRMFDWVASHPRTIGLVYFNKGWSGGDSVYELRGKPRSLALYKSAIRNPRYVSTLP
ncbi:MAG TPA: hypothetical protein VH721_10875 [Gaiellaceae bacterium]|jgi:hypothetical protein